MEFISENFNMAIEQPVYAPDCSSLVDMFLLEQMFSWTQMNYWAPHHPQVIQGLPIDVDLGPGINIPRRKPTLLSMDPHQPILYCKYCRQPFSRRNSLRRHEQLHSGQKPYKCSPCRRSFSRQDIFKRHCASKRCKRISTSASLYS